MSLSPGYQHKWKCYIEETDKGKDPPPAQVQLAAEEQEIHSQPDAGKKNAEKDQHERVDLPQRKLDPQEGGTPHQSEEDEFNPVFRRQFDVLPARAAAFLWQYYFFQDNLLDAHRLQPRGGME